MYSTLLSSVAGHSDYLWLGEVKRRDSSRTKVEGTSKNLSLKEESIKNSKSSTLHIFTKKKPPYRKIQTPKAKFKDVLSIA